MTDPPPRAPGVGLLAVRRLRLVEAAAPPVPPEEQRAMHRAWDEAVHANPSLFDGPVAACAGLAPEGHHGFVVTWVRTTYRRHALRRVPGATACLPSLFVSVLQPTDDGRVLVGRMSSSTAAPGRWQLPGGSVEPPPAGEPLDVAALGRHAARELAEETGVELPAEDLTLWCLTRAENGTIGVQFLAPARPASLLGERFTVLLSDGTARGNDPELDRMALICSQADVTALGGTQVDYLEPVMYRYFAP
ncbi:NUDIX hydrolase [Streptomyces lydicus]|uniref:NUDIX hydrolase n=2 Tax=Streptomyces lydicus TaxID=47763 RepID=A0A1D7VMX0_9ACTN|nr:NUDIX domain-containing protein [Streptomyces lydicus]AOP48082.1 NUDIX hydrolase [Streptomyces lydicus]